MQKLNGKQMFGLPHFWRGNEGEVRKLNVELKVQECDATKVQY